MPLFEYRCQGCDHQFETLVTASRTPMCPKCQGTALTKQLSVFAVSTGSRSAAASVVPMGACGSCGDPRGPGACGMN